MDRKEFDIFELLRLVLQNRKFVGIFVAVVSVGAVIYSLVTPQIWESKATFYVVGENVSGLPIDLPGLSGLGSQLMGLKQSDNAVSSVAALRSRRFSEDVIRHFDLIGHFKINETDSLKAMDKALKRLAKKHVTVKLSSETSLVTILVETKDKKLSKEMIEYYLAKLDDYNRTQKVTKGRMNREFLEARVSETRATIDTLLAEVKDFQLRHDIVDPDAQTSALIDSYSEAVAAKMKADIELELARRNYAESSPVVEELRSRVNALGKQIRELESGTSSLKPRYMIDIASLPEIGSQYAQLKMNLEIQSKVFEYLYPQFEASRLEELRDMPTLDILDSPREAGMRASPKRAVICLIAFVLAFVVAVIIVLIKNVIAQNKDRFREIKESL